MKALEQALASHTWLAIVVALGTFVMLLAAVQMVARVTTAKPESTRKMLHAGSGLLTLSFPFLFAQAWPVALLTVASASLIASIKFVPALRVRFGGAANRVNRTTLGELYFPLSVGLLFWLTRGQATLLYVIPVLMLTLADATCALVGARYGITRYLGASKSLEGSIAFVVVAFFCVHVPLLIWSDVGRVESLLMAATLALLVMLLEGSAWRGLDNVFIPIGGYFLLRAFLPLDAASLTAGFLVTVALVCLVVLVRSRTTLEDDSLVAGAFFCYLAWALMGWRWLVGPMVIMTGYRWLSPSTPHNSKRMHGVPAVLSVWAAAIGWLALARASRDPALLFPYTIVFGTHLAMFGLSRLGFQFPAMSLPALFWRVVITSWAIVMVPFVAVTGVTTVSIAAAGGGLVSIAAGAAVFVRLEPDVRDLPSNTRRWLVQALGGALASAVAWGLVVLISRVLV